MGITIPVITVRTNGSRSQQFFPSLPSNNHLSSSFLSSAISLLNNTSILQPLMTYLHSPDRGEQRRGGSSGRVGLHGNMLKDRFNQVDSQDVLHFLKTKRRRECIKARISALSIYISILSHIPRPFSFLIIEQRHMILFWLALL